MGPIWDYHAAIHCYRNLKPGQVVLDLGSGGGFDVFIAAKKSARKAKLLELI